MTTGEAVRKAMAIALKEMEGEDKTKLAVTNLLSMSGKDKDPKKKADAIIEFETRLITSFHYGDSVQNQIDIANFVLAETGCKGVVILRVVEHYETPLFRIYFRGKTPCSLPETYAIDDFACVKSVINKRHEVIEKEDDIEGLSFLAEWKPLFAYIPDIVVAVPIFQLNQVVTAIVAISFKKKLPRDFMTEKFPNLKSILQNVTPYAMILQATRDYQQDTQTCKIVIKAMEAVNRDKNIRYPDECAITIAKELSKLTECETVSIYQIDPTDKYLQRLYTTGNMKYNRTKHCPNPVCHTSKTFPYFSHKEPLGWVAVSRKTLKINDPSECADYNLHKTALHSGLNCSCKNVLCVPLNDYSEERNLVIELTDKAGGFTQTDMYITALLAQNAAASYSCAVMLAHKEKSYRRKSLLSQILLNVEPVKYNKVEQLLAQLRKIDPSQEFQGPFVELKFNIKNFPDWKMACGILHTFADLDLMNIFKIRRTTLIRFLLSTQQTYRILPYHNWLHACSVAHFNYCLVKNIKLLEHGIMTPLEVFALIVSGLVHDIDHRGTNNRFQITTNSELVQLYNTQESVLERHHLAIALSILRREDCNILENLSPQDYKYFVELLTWNILATDVSKYLQTREANFRALQNFQKHEQGDKLALFSLMMTASDVNDCLKPWDDNLVSVKQILTEFFEQGDLEKSMGMSPLPMMDRTVAYIPEVEYKFLSGIVLPVYSEFAKKFPVMEEHQGTLERYKENWEISTLIFDAHKDNPDQLSILSWPEMKEENLRKIGADKNNPGIRRFSAEKPILSRRATLVIPKTLELRYSIRPESEFRMMFADIEHNKPHNRNSISKPVEDVTIEREIDIVEDSPRCCACSCFKRNRKPSFKLS